MCANYTPVTREERLRAWFAAGQPAPGPDEPADEARAGDRPPEPWPAETWPGYPAPFVRRPPQGAGGRELAVGLFGLVPHWSKDLAIARHTYNARSETVTAKPSFRDAWRHGQRCVVPVESFFEPNWESGRAVRWRIHRRDGAPMGLAGLWGSWRGPDGRELLSFALLTINADGHALMQRFHKPGEEKRMVVLLDADAQERWLGSSSGSSHGGQRGVHDEAHDGARDGLRELLTRCPAEWLEAEPAPRPPRAARASGKAGSPVAAVAALFPEADPASGAPHAAKVPHSPDGHADVLA